MAYVALYREYRPTNFSEVVGQENIKKTLQNAIKLNKVAHAYLFAGPRGTGKTTMAKIMAKAVNCEKGPTPNPCCSCEICQGITKGMISDVIEVDAASNNGADDIREIRDNVKFLPSKCRYKVYIIDEVHMLSQSAFNALLKTLEEPPSHVIFILCTTEPYKLPLTILSRCQRFDFQPISEKEIFNRLKYVSQKENINITDEALDQISTSCEGGMRDALSLLDQTISFSETGNIVLDDVLNVSGNTSYLKIINLINSCIKKEDTSSIQILDEIINEGKEVPKINSDIITFLRDVLLYKNDAVINQKAMYKNESFINLASNITKELIYHYIDILSDCDTRMRYSSSKRPYLEVAILKMSDERLNKENNILTRLDLIERNIEILFNSKNEIKNNEEENYNYKISSFDEPKIEEKIKEIKEDTNNIKEEIAEDASQDDDTSSIIEQIKEDNSNTSDEITIKDITDILYNGKKEKKEALKEAFKQMIVNYQDVLPLQLMLRGEIVAASDDKFIVTLNDFDFCNRVMKYESFVVISEILDEMNLGFKDYICVPKHIWAEIISDFKSKYDKDNNRTPILNDIRIPVKKRVVSNELSEDDKIKQNIYELIDKNDLILEDN
ncbi:MAG: DNA polymerase III subunit gamma/tau [Acholeplasmatales bacterium]|nr:DNA polymerase III subunit gamma/tau [Acholeplasmatales bacterium]